MVDSGVAIKWADNPQWLNHDEEPVDREEDA